jgi:ribosomal protein S18 acetylase RimI-like enzyme
MISIQPATVADTEVLSRIGGQTIFESHGRSAPHHVMQAYVDDKFSPAALEAELLDARNIFHLLHYNGQVAGYSKIIFNTPIDPVPDQKITKLERLYLLEGFHDKKLGHRLLQFNIDLTKLNGQTGMWLYVWKGNDRALKFYERAGFAIVGDGWFRLTAEHANPNWQMYLPYST